MYSQSQEEKFILDFFKGKKGTLLSIGENDGKTFSNALALIESGWSAVLVEPALVAYNKLIELHSNNLYVSCYKVAIGKENTKAILKVSGYHLQDKSDVALLSSLKEDETTKWRNA